MTIFRTLTLASALTLATTPVLAQEGGDTASGKRFSVVGGVTLMEPHSDPATGLDIDGGPAPTLSATWHVTDNWGVELWGAADKFNHRVRGPEGKIGTIEQQPIALSGQYHFGEADNTFRPFVGLGVYESNISNEDIAGGGDHIGLTTPRGAIGTVGVDLNITPTWFARADARYLRARSDARVGSTGETVASDLKLDPWTVGVGIGARF
ncbi:OmpW family protein [Luteimonas yindakuii]|uniref:OmpW family protein n=1 Tax=Luteimonas yindakuii TaxID=2565782 RepID=A0A4Z1RJN3_9GAMM|nr:OmpW family outer membrane protein [Luteimonas yindakuii]TKS54927.1 OmpW family protein [Luteimonas yindakuii]